MHIFYLWFYLWSDYWPQGARCAAVVSREMSLEEKWWFPTAADRRPSLEQRGSHIWWGSLCLQGENWLKRKQQIITILSIWKRCTKQYRCFNQTFWALELIFDLNSGHLLAFSTTFNYILFSSSTGELCSVLHFMLSSYNLLRRTIKGGWRTQKNLVSELWVQIVFFSFSQTQSI